MNIIPPICILFFFFLFNGFAQSDCLIGDYRFSGNVLDSSDHQNHGNPFNVTFGEDRFGNENSSVFFNGENSFIQLPEDDFLNEDYIISVWVKPVFPQAEKYGCILSIGSAGGNDQVLTIANDPNFDNVGYSFGSWLENGNISLSENNERTESIWTHLVIEKKENELTLTIDGVQVDSGTHFSPTTYGNTPTAFLGNRLNIKQYFHGYIDDLKIFGCSTEDEITRVTQIEYGCDSLKWNVSGKTYFNSGTYKDSIFTENKLDSIIILELHLGHTSTDSTIAITCPDYFWEFNGETYHESGVYFDTLLGSLGCDSIGILDLTLAVDSVTYDTVAQCSRYTWPFNGKTYVESGTYFDSITNAEGCKEVSALIFTKEQYDYEEIVVNACGSYFWESTDSIYMASGIYTDTIPSGECPKIISLDLSIFITNANVDSTNSPELIATQQWAGYQWLNCDADWQEISGETNREFTPNTNGSYAVEVTYNGCKDTSECVKVNSLGINSNPGFSNITFYPNPTSGKLFLKGSSYRQNDEILITTIEGKQILNLTPRELESNTYFLNLPKGIYLIHLRNKSGIYHSQKIALI